MPYTASLASGAPSALTRTYHRVIDYAVSGSGRLRRRKAPDVVESEWGGARYGRESDSRGYTGAGRRERWGQVCWEVCNLR